MADHETRRELEEKETGRLEAFSDGVFAIAITLLVLELRAPEGPGPLGARLLAQWPSFAAFVTSFATIGIMWLNHHRLFMLVRRVDHWLLVLNGVLLFGVSVLPFPTELVARQLQGPGKGLAVAIYSGTYIYIALAFNVLWRYASSPRRKPSLLRLSHAAPEVVAIHAQYRMGPVGYVAAAVLAHWNAEAALGLMMALALFFLIPPRTPHARSRASAPRPVPRKKYALLHDHGVGVPRSHRRPTDPQRILITPSRQRPRPILFSPLNDSMKAETCPPLRSAGGGSGREAGSRGCGGG